jgi:hypothetical protein
VQQGQKGPQAVEIVPIGYSLRKPASGRTALVRSGLFLPSFLFSLLFSQRRQHGRIDKPPTGRPAANALKFFERATKQLRVGPLLGPSQEAVGRSHCNVSSGSSLHRSDNELRTRAGMCYAKTAQRRRAGARSGSAEDVGLLRSVNAASRRIRVPEYTARPRRRTNTGPRPGRP